MVFGLANFVAFNADYLIVGHVANVTQVGLYSLAFTLAFAPLTRFAWPIGRVLLPAAAAAPGVEVVGRQTLYALRVIATLLLPMVPVAIVLAPWVLPGLLGERWEGMVVPFQLLLVAGVAHAVLNVLGESLAGTGHMAFRARVTLVYLVGMVATLVLLVNLDGIRGAAIAHILMFVPLATAFVVWGSPHIGLSPGRVGAALQGVVVPVAAQVAVTVGLLTGLEGIGVGSHAAEVLGAAAGLGVVAALLSRGPASPLRQGVDVFRMALRGSAA
jgi:O-antigen/teichoic acid export membrane protein